MPTVIHCHTGRRLLAVVAGWAIAIVAMALSACSVAEFEHTALASEAPRNSSQGTVDPDYFPSQFPAPTGEVEPLPPQF
jgi:hypothetical protein